MANDLVHAGGDLLDVGGSASEADRLVRLFNSQMEHGEGGTKMLPSLPTAEERRVLIDRRAFLNTQMRPVGTVPSSDRDKLAARLSRLFNGFPSLLNHDVKGMIVAYSQHLADLPLFAVLAVCEDIQRGRIKDANPDWPPSSARIYLEAEKHLGALREEHGRIDRILSIRFVSQPALSDEARERGAAMLKGVVAELNAKAEEQSTIERAERTRAARGVNDDWMLREYRARGIEPQYGPFGLISLSLVEKIQGDKRALGEREVERSKEGR